jgi:hypothetical protein
MMESLIRTAVVMGAFAVACLAAAIAFVLCFQVPALMLLLQAPDVSTLDRFRTFTSATVSSTLMVWPILMALAFLPIGLTIAYAERAAKRSIWYFLGVWVVIALLPTIPTVVAEMVRKGQYDLSALIIAQLVATGLAGGAVYWALAGRGSGNWHRRVPPPQEAPPSA